MSAHRRCNKSINNKYSIFNSKDNAVLGSNSGRSVLPILLIFVTVIAVALGGLLVYSNFFKKDTRYIGTWERELDLTDYVTRAMDEWLGTAVMGTGIDYGDKRVTIKMTLTLSKDGSWHELIDADDYMHARDMAGIVATAGLYDFLEKRMAAGDMSPSLAGKTTKQILIEAVGMEGNEYLKKYGPKLIPELTELIDMYNKVGTYVIDDNVIARKCITGTAVYEYFAIDKNVMIFAGNVSPDDLKGVLSASDSLATTINGADFQEIRNDHYPIAYIRK